jgi:flagellar motor switch protein FliM
MSVLHETFSRQATSILTSRFKVPCHVHVASVDQLTYDEFIRSVPTPTTIAVLNTGDPLSNKIILEIDPAVSFSFINRAFDGKTFDIKHQHELTRLEWVVMKEVIKELTGCLSEGWKLIVPELSISISHVDTTPQFINLSNPADMTVLITIEAKIGELEGMINICYPQDCLNNIMEKLTAAFLYGAKTAPQKKYKLTNRWDIPVEMAAEIFRRDYSIQKILDWKNEELLLPLIPRAPNTCYLRFDNSRIFQCEMLEDYKWFPKKIKIINISEHPQGTEGKMELNTINPMVAETLAEAGITISVELGRTAKTVNEILKMGEGTIVELDKLAGEPVDIKANGVLIAKGEVVVIDENFGVRVIEIINSSSLNSSELEKE